MNWMLDFMGGVQYFGACREEGLMRDVTTEDERGRSFVGSAFDMLPRRAAVKAMCGRMLELCSVTLGRLRRCVDSDTLVVRWHLKRPW
jgi:hypothetical protein